MPTRIEPQRLSGVDRGKRVRFTGAGPRQLEYEGELVQVKHLGDGGTTLVILTNEGGIEWEHLGPGSRVEITGIPSKPCGPRHSLSSVAPSRGSRTTRQ